MLARGVAGRGAHQRVCPLQPDRGAGDGRRIARRPRRPTFWWRPVSAGSRRTRRCSTSMPRWAWSAAALYRRLPHAVGRGEGRDHAARAVAPDRLQARRPVQPGFVRRRLRRAVAAGAVAVRALRPVALGREPVLLLDQRADGVFLSGCRMAFRPHRADQHHGVHSHSVEHVPDPGGVLARPDPDAGLAADPLRLGARWTCRRARPT